MDIITDEIFTQWMSELDSREVELIAGRIKFDEWPLSVRTIQPGPRTGNKALSFDGLGK
jgi:hypothetical protein